MVYHNDQLLANASLLGLPISSQCTLLVAAAGKGSRLGYSAPKTLYKVNEKPIIDHILDSFLPFCQNVVLIVSEIGLPVIKKHVHDRKKIVFAVQKTPRGMADAVKIGLECCSTPYVACIWGDQPFVNPNIIGKCLDILSTQQISMVLPVCRLHNSYINIDIDDSTGRILRVLQRREGDVMPECGIADCSVFFFRTDEMKTRLGEAMGAGLLQGRATGEQNFLPIMPFLDRVLLYPIEDINYCPGINTPEDAKVVECMLRERCNHLKEQGFDNG